jgi:hypothetical protein
MKQYLAFLIIILSYGCAEKQSTSKVSIFNSTLHKVTLAPYINGIVDSSKYKILQPNESFSVETNYQRGKTKIPVVFWNYFKNLDSLVVIWDETYHMTHMLSDTFYSSNNFIQFAENRNIGLSTSYVNSIKSESKHSIEWSVINTLTEQDYLDAKN